MGQLNSLIRISNRSGIFSFEQVHNWEAAVEIADSFLIVVVFHVDGEEIEVGDVVHGLQLEGGLYVLDGGGVFVELWEEDGAIGKQHGIVRVFLYEHC